MYLDKYMLGVYCISVVDEMWDLNYFPILIFQYKERFGYNWDFIIFNILCVFIKCTYIYHVIISLFDKSKPYITAPQPKYHCIPAEISLYPSPNITAPSLHFMISKNQYHNTWARWPHSKHEEEETGQNSFQKYLEIFSNRCHETSVTEACSKWKYSPEAAQQSDLSEPGNAPTDLCLSVCARCTGRRRVNCIKHWRHGVSQNVQSGNTSNIYYSLQDCAKQDGERLHLRLLLLSQRKRGAGEGRKPEEIPNHTRGRPIWAERAGHKCPSMRQPVGTFCFQPLQNIILHSCSISVPLKEMNGC